jgi:hypothetical protein
MRHGSLLGYFNDPVFGFRRLVLHSYRKSICGRFELNYLSQIDRSLLPGAPQL